MAQGLGETYKRIAALEYPASADRVAYQYFGSQVGARPLKIFPRRPVHFIRDRTYPYKK